MHTPGDGPSGCAVIVDQLCGLAARHCTVAGLSSNVESFMSASGETKFQCSNGIYM